MNETLFQLSRLSLIHNAKGIAAIEVDLRAEKLSLHITELSEAAQIKREKIG